MNQPAPPDRRAEDTARERVSNDSGCKHPDEPHTVMWWDFNLNDPHQLRYDIPMPMSTRFDNRDDAVEAATRIRDDVEAGRRSPLQTDWIKVFRSDNENYTCWRWPVRKWL